MTQILFKELSYKIIGAAMEVHRVLGPGFLEAVYEAPLAHELTLQGVPFELYEAAQIDGASMLAKFRHITLPMISPAILFNLVLGVIGALKVFGMAYVATQGGPNYGSWFFALHIYSQAFLYFRLGYGSALAWVFAAIVIAFTLVQLKISGRWVYYAGGS